MFESISNKEQANIFKIVSAKLKEPAKWLRWNYYCRFNVFSFNHLEQLFRIRFIVYSEHKKNILYKSKSLLIPVIKLLHLKSKKKFIEYKIESIKICDRCERLFVDGKKLASHIGSNKCKSAGFSKHVFVGKGYPFGENKELFTLLASLGISIPNSLRNLNTIATFDIETRYEKVSTLGGPNTNLDQKLIPFSYAMATNLKGVKDYFYYSMDGGLVFDSFWKKAHWLGTIAYNENLKQFKPVFKKLLKLKLQVRLAIVFDDNSISTQWGRDKNNRLKEHFNAIEGVISRLHKFIRQLPIFGFSSSRFDMMVFAPYLVKLVAQDPKSTSIVKRGGGMLIVSTKNFKILDFQSYVGPGFTLDRIIKLFAPELKVGKLIFPFSILSSNNLLERLNSSEFPSRDLFYNDLKREEISEDDYSKVLAFYLNMPTPRTLLAYLKLYNLHDVRPFLQAMLNFANIFKELTVINIYREAFTLPSIAKHILANNLDSGAIITLMNSEKTHNLISSGNRGGCSIIFHRACLSESAFPELNLPPEFYQVPGVKGKLGSVASYDCTAMYSACLLKKRVGLNDPFYYEGVDSKEKKFTGELNQSLKGAFMHKSMHMSELKALAYFEKIQREMGFCRNHKFITEFSGGQVSCGKLRLPVDGFCSSCRMIFSFQGCYFHPHLDCLLCKSTIKTPLGLSRMKHTKRIIKSLEEDGFQVFIVRECEFNRMKEKDPSVQKFLLKYFTPPYCKKLVTGKKLLNAVRNNTFFGLMQVGIRVPAHLREFYDRCPPFHILVDVKRSMLTEHQLKVVKESNLLTQPSTLLIPVLEAKKMTVSTDLLLFYLQKGFEVFKVYSAMSWLPGTPFLKLGEKIFSSRIKAAVDPNLAASARIWKLVGNCFFGTAMTNPEKFTKYTIIAGNSALDKALRNPLLKNIVEHHSSSTVNLEEEEVEDVDYNSSSYYELESQPNKMLFKYPISLAFFLLGSAKLSLLDFAYHLLNTVDICIVGSDTDNLLIASRSKTGNLNECVKEGQMKLWESRKAEFFTIDDSIAEYYRPLVYKLENVAHNCLALGAKSYIMFNNDEIDSIAQKTSLKGVQNRKANNLTPRRFIQTLLGDKFVAENRGFIRKNLSVYRYVTQKIAGRQVYLKRKCGFNTEKGTVEWLSTKSFF